MTMELISGCHLREWLSKRILCLISWCLKGYSVFTFGGRNSVFVLRNLFFMSFLSQKRKKVVVRCGVYFFILSVVLGTRLGWNAIVLECWYSEIENEARFSAWSTWLFVEPITNSRHSNTDLLLVHIGRNWSNKCFQNSIGV